jgi:hypothetical protein
MPWIQSGSSRTIRERGQAEQHFGRSHVGESRRGAALEHSLLLVRRPAPEPARAADLEATCFYEVPVVITIRNLA